MVIRAYKLAKTSKTQSHSEVCKYLAENGVMPSLDLARVAGAQRL
jgi:hypothetical protein